MKIFLDDVRDLPRDKYNPLVVDPFYADFIIVRSAKELLDILTTPKLLELTHISFDHDLGENVQHGYDMAKWFESLAANGVPLNLEWYGIHSANPVGAKNIDAAMKNVMRMLGR